jgi:hypothetical protein
MRNTLLFFGLKWHFKFDDGVNPPIEFDVAVFGETEEDLVSVVESTNAATTGGDPNYVITYPNPAIKAYFCFDKANVAKMIKVIPQFFYDECCFNPFTNAIIAPDQQLLRVQVNESPRNTGWTDSDGVKRAAAPTDKGKTSTFAGAGGLIDAFLALEAYAQSLKDEGRIRDAGIVQSAIDEVLAQEWSITEAFDFLRNAGLL